MSCGCKGDKKSPEILNHLNQETKELNLKGKLLKIPTAIFFTLLMVILSPFLLVFIWYLVMVSVFDSKSSVIDIMLSKFQKKPIDESEEYLGEFNEDDYEVINVDIIK